MKSYEVITRSYKVITRSYRRERKERSYRREAIMKSYEVIMKSYRRKERKLEREVIGGKKEAGTIGLD